jgi:hypothetical protein
LVLHEGGTCAAKPVVQPLRPNQPHTILSPPSPSNKGCIGRTMIHPTEDVLTGRPSGAQVVLLGGGCPCEPPHRQLSRFSNCCRSLNALDVTRASAARRRAPAPGIRLPDRGRCGSAPTHARQDTFSPPIQWRALAVPFTGALADCTRIRGEDVIVVVAAARGPRRSPERRSFLTRSGPSSLADHRVAAVVRELACPVGRRGHLPLQNDEGML